MRNIHLLFSILVILTVISSKVMASGFVVNVESSMSIIPADGKSYSQIMVTVTDPSGAPVPDGLDVRFASTAGSITPYSRLGAGRASAVLISSLAPQLAMVTVMVGGMTGSAQIEFASTVGDAVPTPKIIRMNGGSIAYSLDRDTVLAKDNVTLEYRGMTVKAMNIQVSETLGVIRAEGRVIVKQGSDSVQGDAFTCDLRTGHCRVLQDGASPIASIFDISKLQKMVKSTESISPSDYAPLDATGSKSWIISRRLTIFPNERIQFFRASIYLGDAKVVKMPFYSYNLQSRESIIQQVKYTSQNGLVVDFPYYYHMADSSAGALKLRYSGTGSDYGGYFQPRKGFSLGLEQAYSGNDKMEGRVFVDSVMDSTRSVELAHHMEFGSYDHFGRIDLTARYQPTSDFAKGVYNTGLNITGGLEKCDYSITAYMGGSRFRTYDFLNPTNVQYLNQQDGSIQATLRPKRTTFSTNPVRLSPTWTVGYGRVGYTPGVASNPALYQTLGMGLGYSPISKNGLSLSLDGQTALTTTAEGQSGVGMRMGPSLRKYWHGGSASLGYVLNLQSGTVTGIYGTSKHMMNASFSLISNSKWNCIANVGYGLDTGQLNLFSNASYRIAKKWTLRTNYSLYRYKYATSLSSITSEVSYLKAGIYSPIGPYEVGLAWSPNGEDYGLKPNKRLFLEIGLSGL